MRPAALLACAAIGVFRPQPALAQTDASVAVGSGTVRFPDGSRLGLLSVAPALRLLSPYRQVTAGATLARLSRGGWYGQGHVAMWAATHPLAARWQLAADVDLGGTALEGPTATGAGHLTAEALWAAPRWGVAAGVGGASGWGSGMAAITAPHARLRAWWQSFAGRVAVTGDIEPTRFLGAWYADVDAGLVVRRDRLDLHLWTSTRLSTAYGSKLGALASATWRLSPVLALEASGGSVLSDPYQGLPRSGFVAAGVRLHLPRRGWRGDPAFRSDRIKLIPREGGLVLRLRQHGAQRVTIAGDWNAWLPTPLTRTGTDGWQITLPLASGTYHFTVLVDGVPWTVPDGVPTVPDGMGGRVAVLTVL